MNSFLSVMASTLIAAGVLAASTGVAQPLDQPSSSGDMPLQEEHHEMGMRTSASEQDDIALELEEHEFENRVRMTKASASTHPEQDDVLLTVEDHVMEARRQSTSAPSRIADKVEDHVMETRASGAAETHDMVTRPDGLEDHDMRLLVRPDRVERTEQVPPRPAAPASGEAYELARNGDTPPCRNHGRVRIPMRTRAVQSPAGTMHVPINMR